MDLRDIEAFLTIYETRSFSKAAEKLFISQSAISNRIRKLEEGLNSTLFLRNNGKILSITKDGEVIYEDLKQVQQLIESTKVKLQQAPVIKEVAISFPVHIGSPTFERFFALAKEKHPNYNFTFHFNVSTTVLKAVTEGSIDIGFGLFVQRLKHKEIGIERISDFDNVLVCSPHNRLLRQPIIQLSDLKDEKIIVFSQSAELTEIFNEKNVEVNLKIIEIQNRDIIEKMVMNQEGISLFPRFAVQDDLKKGDLAEMKLDFEFPKTSSVLIYKKWIPKELIDTMIVFARKLYT